MLFEMIAGAALAAGAQNDTPFETFDDTIAGWSVVRRPDGCFAFSEASGTAISIFYKADLANQPLLVLFGNRAWRLRRENVRGYRIQFVGADGDWTDLGASTFPEDDDGTETGFVAMSFTEDAVAPMLTDIAGASSLNLYRDAQLLASVPLGNGSRATQRLLDCVQAVAGRTMPGPPAR